MHFQGDLAADGLLSCYKDRPSCLADDLPAEVNFSKSDFSSLIERVEEASKRILFSGGPAGEEHQGGEKLRPVLDQPRRPARQCLDGGGGDPALNAWTLPRQAYQFLCLVTVGGGTFLRSSVRNYSSLGRQWALPYVS